MKTPLAPDDLHRFRWLDHARLSPSGRAVAYQLAWADGEARENGSVVMVQPLQPGAQPVEVGGTGRRDHSPEWSPDGARLALLCRSGPTDQLHVAPAQGGRAVRLTSLPEGVQAVRWSPDGSFLALLARVLAEPEAVVDDPRPPDSPEQARRSPVARVARRLDYRRDGDGFTDGRQTHLFVVPADGGEPRQLTHGPWSVEGFDWAPDGRRLVVSGDAEPDSDLRRESQLYVVGLDGSLRLLVEDMKATAPAWSPTGDLIAFLAPAGPEAGRHERVWVVPAEGGKPRCLTIGLDRSCDGGILTDMRVGHLARLVWSEDGGRVSFIASGPGVAEVCSVDTRGEVRTDLACPRRAAYDFDRRQGQLVACVTDPANPGDLVWLTDGGELRLTDSNPWLRERWLAEPERHTFTAPDGIELEGWLLRPPDFDPRHRYPLVLEVHGGPHGQYGWAFTHEFQVLAGQGLLVFYLNPRGSDGYGEAFKRAVVGDWGGRDHEDLISALDQLIDRTGFVDTERLGVAGGSYGGYMTNWIIGHTRRFRAAVSMRSICNLVSDHAQHDIVPWFLLEVGPAEWPDPQELWRRSPLRYVADIHTPLLLLHGEADYRCPISQAEELFGALRLLGREVVMVRFPGESHDLSRSGRPDRRLEHLRRLTDWFRIHLLAGVNEEAQVSRNS